MTRQKAGRNCVLLCSDIGLVMSLVVNGDNYIQRLPYIYGWAPYNTIQYNTIQVCIGFSPPSFSLSSKQRPGHTNVGGEPVFRVMVAGWLCEKCG